MPLTEHEIERRKIMVDAGLEHYGACACGVGAKGVEARLYRCNTCNTKACFQCSRKHICEVQHA